MHRFYCKNIHFDEETVQLTDSPEVHHIKNVLRLKKNTEIQLFSNSGKEALGVINNITSEAIEIKIKKIYPKPLSLETQVILACALPKKGKFELIIEKATELGVHEIYPLETARTEVKLKGERAAKKRARFETVAINAAKQSKRAAVPLIHPVTSFKDCVKDLSQDAMLLIPSLEENSRKLTDLSKKIFSAQRIAFFIGPEGDFTVEEYAFAKKQKCLSITLGPTILKVETAAICVMSYLRQVTLQ